MGAVKYPCAPFKCWHKSSIFESIFFCKDTVPLKLVLYGIGSDLHLPELMLFVSWYISSLDIMKTITRLLYQMYITTRGFI